MIEITREHLGFALVQGECFPFKVVIKTYIMLKEFASNLLAQSLVKFEIYKAEFYISSYLILFIVKTRPSLKGFPKL